MVKNKHHIQRPTMIHIGTSFGDARSRLPNKARVFWWRVSRDFIPCRANLHRMHIDPIGTCGFGGIEDETTYHALTQSTTLYVSMISLGPSQRSSFPDYVRSQTRDPAAREFLLQGGRQRCNTIYVACSLYGSAEMIVGMAWQDTHNRPRSSGGRGHWRPVFTFQLSIPPASVALRVEFSKLRDGYRQGLLA